MAIKPSIICVNRMIIKLTSLNFCRWSACAFLLPL